jgi:hypothetical protein
VDRGFKMLVQECKFAKEAMAKIALIGFDKVVPCSLGGLVAGAARPIEQLLGDDAIGITASDSLVELVAVERGLGARPALQVVNQAGGCSMCLVTERAPDGAVAVELAVQMLLDVNPEVGRRHRSRTYHIDVVPVLEVSITGGAVEVLLDLVVA